MDVTIIMVNYNTKELTKNAIDSIIEKTKDITYEIILVDNDSKDGSQEYFSNLKIDNFKYIKSDQNLGFGKANNLGYKNSKGNYLFLLNTDTLLINNAIKILFDIMESNKKIGICGGNLYNDKNEPVHSFMNCLYSIKIDFKTEVNSILKVLLKKQDRLFDNKNRSDFNYSNELREVGYITGADMMIRRECIEKVGFFNPDFFMYFEETELSSRIRKEKYKIISVPEAKIVHLEGKSTIFKENKIRMFNESKFMYFEKVYGKHQKWIVFCIAQISNFIKYLISFDKNYLKIIQINKEVIKK
ncbi:glycosyltransferase family 2 protein [Cetobacterium sp.]|uniref:glycosyltransferase family 2 protein n=1 Tax=Cetobacterium sp. TaxID=2071632 RepID=UPI003EE6AFE2